MNEDEIIYRQVVGFPGYFVGTDGTVWSCWRKMGRHKAIIGNKWKLLSPSKTTRYLRVNLSKDGKVYYKMVHIAILEAFIGPCPEGMEGCHNNGNPFDCRLSNIRWDTKSNNYKDRHKHGTSNDGVRNGRAKLDEVDVAEIRELISLGMTQVECASLYGVSQPSIIHDKERGSLGPCGDMMKIQLCSLLLNESEWLLKNYEQHKAWPGLCSWVFVHGADYVYGQTSPEMVTAEGFSVDDTRDILDDIASKDNRVTVIHHGWMSHSDKAQGKCAGRNRYLDVADTIRPDFLIISDLDEFYTYDDQHQIVQLLQQDIRIRSFNGFVFKQRQIWYPPIMAAHDRLTGIFSREVVGGYWAVPHCRVWSYLPGMRYVNNHNTPESRNGISFKAQLKRYDKLPSPPFGDWPECIHLGYASTANVRLAKHRYYEARGEGQNDGRKSYINCRRAWEIWQEGYPLPHGAMVIPYDGPVPECFQAPPNPDLFSMYNLGKSLAEDRKTP